MMRDRRTNGPGLLGPIICCTLAVAAMSLGPRGEHVVRSLIRDLSRPGYSAGSWLSARCDELDPARWPWTRDAMVERSAPTSRSEDSRLEVEVRRLRYELAQERRKLERFDASLGPVRGGPSNSIGGVRRITARIIPQHSDVEGAGGIILTSGSTRGMVSQKIAVAPFVASADGMPLPDDAPILAGAAVVGRTDEVGGWTATVLPLTDSRFRAHVTLVQTGPDGTVMGEQGIIEGDGAGGCIVKYVPSTAVVAVGDHVYSFDPTGRMTQPLYYGRVDRATLHPSAPHWDLHVRPAAELSQLHEVHVLLEASPDPDLAADR